MKVLKKKTILIIGIISISVSIVVFGFIVIADNFLPLGSQRFTEFYKFHSTEMNLINAVEKFEVKNPDYLLPDTVYLPSGQKIHMNKIQRDTNLYAYFFYLYDSNKNQIIVFYIRQQSEASCTLGFIGVNQGLTLGNCKIVNDNINSEDNRELKKEFEENILDKLGIKYEKEGNSAPIFNNWFNKHKKTNY